MSSAEMINDRISKPRTSVDAGPSLRRDRHLAPWLMLCLLATIAGCTSLASPISGVPAHRLPPQFLPPPKNNLIPIDISRLRQEPPRQYLVDAGDILGIYIEGVLGKPDEPPPVHMPDRDSDLPPAIGFPIPIREDGSLALPLIPALTVRGLTLAQVENMIRKAYTQDSMILQEGKDRIIVTLMMERTYRIVVMRQDGAAQQQFGGGAESVMMSGFSSTRSDTVNLPAYKNDVLNALAETGGLPGVDAKNEIKILRSSLMDARKRDEFVRAFYSQSCEDPCLCHPPLPEDPAIVRIPLRLPPGETPRFSPQDIILNEGDLILIESRDREVFYTGGLLGGGQFPLPRDYDLDVIGALSIAGAGVGGSGRSGGAGGAGGAMGINSGSVGGVPPGQLYVLRKTPCNGQITIAVDLARAANDPSARPLVQPGDILILQYKPAEEILNFGLGTFFTYGITQLFQGNN
jgi:protein involved in polysaccharide export with SLBB domain